MIPEIFRINIFDLISIPIYSFGLMMLLCFVGSMKLLEICLEEKGYSKDLAESMITYAAIGGILGARLLSIITNLDSLIKDPVGTIFSTAGFVFYGGFIGGVFGVVYFLKRNNFSPIKFTNIVAAPLAFGYAIGRLGCQLSGDGDYGTSSNLPWAMNYLYGVIPTSELVHPTPTYESILSLGLATFLRSKYCKNLDKVDGALFGIYLFVSALFRFSIEMIRIEPVVYLNLSQAQIIAIFLAIISLYFLLNIQKNNSSI